MINNLACPECGRVCKNKGGLNQHRYGAHGVEGTHRHWRKQKTAPLQAPIHISFISLLEDFVNEYKTLKSENEQLRIDVDRWKGIAGKMLEDLDAAIRS